MSIRLALAFIISLGVFLRTWQLTAVPPSLSHDETAIAYNAYSVLTTGRDEYGQPFPLLFRSFDDYKLPGMVYSTIPFAALFKKSELTARLPSAMYGILSIVILYCIAREILIGTKKTKLSLFPVFSALFLAIQPWHINFSRQLFESNGAVFWFLLGTLFLLKSTRKYPYILLAALSYSIALYFYYSVRLVIPFVLLLYFFMQVHTIRKHWKHSLLAGIIGLLIFFPLGIQMLSPGGRERISIVSVTNDPNFIARREIYTLRIAKNPTLINTIIFNRRVALIQTIAENYGKNISLRNLFVSGTGTYGVLFPFEILLIIIGFFGLLALRPFPALLVCVWIFAAFLPGAFSLNQPNTLRTLLAAPAFAVLSGLGLALIIHTYRSTKRLRPIISIVLAVLLFSFFYEFPRFYRAYFSDNPMHNALGFGDGNKQVAAYLTAHHKKYTRVYVSGYYWRPYVFFLYWGNTDPTQFQRNGTREQIGNITFAAASWDTSGLKFMDPDFDFRLLPDAKTALFILSEQEYQTHAASFKKIQDIDGRIVPAVFIAAQLTP